MPLLLASDRAAFLMTGAPHGSTPVLVLATGVRGLVVDATWSLLARPLLTVLDGPADLGFLIPTGGYDEHTCAWVDLVEERDGALIVLGSWEALPDTISDALLESAVWVARLQ